MKFISRNLGLRQRGRPKATERTKWIFRERKRFSCGTNEKNSLNIKGLLKRQPILLHQNIQELNSRNSSFQGQSGFLAVFLQLYEFLQQHVYDGTKSFCIENFDLEDDFCSKCSHSKCELDLPLDSIGFDTRLPKGRRDMLFRSIPRSPGWCNRRTMFLYSC